MSTSQRISDTQDLLFRQSRQMGQSLDMDSDVRKFIHGAYRRCSKSRQVVAEELSRLIGREVSVAMLDAFAAETKAGHRFPAAWLAAFVLVTGETDVLRQIVETAGYRLITNDEAMLIDYARACLARKNAEEKISTIEHQLTRGSKR